jgi:hypothetical protein
MPLCHHLASFILAYTTMSFIEYATHRWMLHMNTLANLFPRRQKIRQHLHEHAVSHHSTFYKCFRREDHPHGKHVGMLIPFAFYKYIGALILVIGLIDCVSGFYLLVMVGAHFVVWNIFHEAMHFYKKPWYVVCPPISWWYRYVEYYHFLHHQHRNKNYNAFLPMWDYLLGTSAPVTALDRDVWRLMNDGQFVDRKGKPLSVVEANIYR